MITTSCRMAEVHFKLLTHWHYTPVKLHAMFTSNSPLCWRDCADGATHGHIWWSCHKIHTFWEEVAKLVSLIQGEVIRPEPFTFLFHCMKEAIGQYRMTMTPHLLNKGKSLIPIILGKTIYTYYFPMAMKGR